MARCTESGSQADEAAIATEPSNVATVRRNASSGPSPSARRREIRAGMTLASVVISAAERRLSAPQVGVIVHVTVERGHHVGTVGPVGSDRS